MLVNTVLVLVITLLSIAASGTAEAVFSSFKILGPSGAVLETFTQRSGEVKHIDLRSSTKVEMEFDVNADETQASVIIQRHAGDDKNVVVFASPAGGKLKAIFGWDSWKNRYGDIEQGSEFAVSVAVWGDQESVRRTDVAMLTFVSGPTAAPTPGKVPLSTRITDAVASMSRKPDIVHMFRPEERMVPVLVSYACTIVVLAPLVGALLLMSKSTVDVGVQSGAKLLAAFFYGGIVLIMATEVAFWFGALNLLEVFPVLVALELCVMASGIRLSKRNNKIE